MNDLCELAVIILWCIWKNKNDVVWNGRGKRAHDTYIDAIFVYDQKSMSNLLHDVSENSHTCLGSRQWIKPPEGVLKCNVDAFVSVHSSFFGFGCVMRNSFGVVLVVVHGNLVEKFDPSFAEAISVREALSWLKNLDYPNIIMESDALVVVDALNNSEPDSSCFGIVDDDCKILAMDFSSCHFGFCYRSANRAARALTRKVVSTTGMLC